MVPGTPSLPRNLPALENPELIAGILGHQVGGPRGDHHEFDFHLPTPGSALRNCLL